MTAKGRRKWQGRWSERKTGIRFPEAGIVFPESHRKPLESFKQEACTIQLMLRQEDFGCGAGKNTPRGDRRERRQTSRRGFCRGDKR